jgi:hypothetical protein
VIGPGFGIRDSGFALVIAACALVASACGGNNPASPSTTSTVTTENWSGVLAPGGASSRSFTVTNAGTITITMNLAGATVGLGVGLPRVTGGGCRVGVQVVTGASSNPQISTAAEAGLYCVQLFDTGTLTDPVPFNVKIDHP